MKVYVYKEYNDDMPYGNELIEVYAREEDAKARLRESFREFLKIYDMDDYQPDADETVNDTYVSILWYGCGCFWIIEECEVIP